MRCWILRTTPLRYVCICLLGWLASVVAHNQRGLGVPGLNSGCWSPRWPSLAHSSSLAPFRAPAPLGAIISQRRRCSCTGTVLCSFYWYCWEVEVATLVPRHGCHHGAYLFEVAIWRVLVLRLSLVPGRRMAMALPHAEVCRLLFGVSIAAALGARRSDCETVPSVLREQKTPP